MSGVLHPVGPEPARTYWIRRGLLLAVVLLLALGAVVAVAGLTKAAVATAPPPPIAPASSPSELTRTGAGPSPSASSPAGASSLSVTTTPSAHPTPAANPTPSGASRSSAATASAGTASTGSTAMSPTAGTRPARPSSSAVPATPRPTSAGTPDCRSSDLQVKIKGDRTPTRGKQVRFTLSLLNDSRQTCLASVTDKNFELKIYSGKDRIWSSRDCSKVLDDFDKRLAAAATVEWRMIWNGKRSVDDAACKKAPERPQPGTYWATAQLKGAEPVQLRMIMA